MADADRLTLSLSTGGDVVIKLRPDLAPGHVQRITELASSGFYDNVVFHRVIPGFMAQGGDPTGTGYHGSDLPNIKAEFSATPHKRGAGISPAFHRFAMLVLATADDAGFSISTIELDEPERPYAVDTVARIQDQIHDDLLDLPGIDRHLAQVRRTLGEQLHVFADQQGFPGAAADYEHTSPARNGC